MNVTCDKCGIQKATHHDSGSYGWFLNLCDECDPPKPKSAYRDAEGWVLFNEAGEPVNWPKDWPPIVDSDFLKIQGVTVAA